MAQRDNSLDVLRGLLLVMITINHIGGPVSMLSYQPMSFVSAAEGFVFLSGNVLGLVYGKRLLRGIRFSFSTVWRRSVKIYLYHLVTLLIIISPYFLIPSKNSVWHFQELKPFFTDSGNAIPAYLFLLFQPDHLDILPMYILFIPVGFFVLKAFTNNKGNWIMAASLILWLISQFKFSNNFSPFQLNPGFFNLFSWQLLFVIGTYVGFQRSQGKNIVGTSKTLFVSVCTMLLLFAVVRYTRVYQFSIFEFVRAHADKPDLEFFRLVNFLGIAYFINFVNKSGYFPKSKYLAFLGQHSLQVFSFQIVLIYFFSPLRDEVYHFSFAGRILVQFVGALLLFIPASVHSTIINRRNTASVTRSKERIVVNQ